MSKDKTFDSVSWKLCHNEKVLIDLKYDLEVFLASVCDIQPMSNAVE